MNIKNECHICYSFIFNLHGKFQSLFLGNNLYTEVVTIENRVKNLKFLFVILGNELIETI